MYIPPELWYIIIAYIGITVNPNNHIRCLATNQNGKICRRKKYEDNLWCHQHFNLFEFKNETSTLVDTMRKFLGKRVNPSKFKYVFKTKCSLCLYPPNQIPDIIPRYSSNNNIVTYLKYKNSTIINHHFSYIALLNEKCISCSLYHPDHRTRYLTKIRLLKNNPDLNL